MTLPGSELHETYVAANTITHIASATAGDTEIVKLEGHTVDGSGDFTFVIQSVTLAGQTKTALGTPLARVTRCYNTGATDLVGAVYIAEDVTFTAGVPQTDTAIHAIVRAGKNQTEKCATTLSSVDYWIITHAYMDVLEKTAAFASTELQVREKGSVFLQKVAFAASSGTHTSFSFDPYLIAPANSDVRLVAVADGASTDVGGGIQGFLATVDVRPWTND